LTDFPKELEGFLHRGDANLRQKAFGELIKQLLQGINARGK
jgi:hypothetical protein